MKLYFDENMGRGVPEALRMVGFRDVNHSVNMFSVGIADEEWIPIVGSEWLVISKDQNLLRRPEQRRLLARHRLGLVCITSSSARARDLLAFMLRRMERLEQLDDATTRPFAFRVSLHGPFQEVTLRDVA